MNRVSCRCIGTILIKPLYPEQQKRILQTSINAIRKFNKHTAKGGGAAGHLWSAQDLTTLRDTASNFSSLSPVLCKEQKDHHIHSHEGLFTSHAHTHDSREIASKMDMIEHNQAGSRITLVGMGANMGMSVAKGAAGVYFHSSALLADAAHSLSDILGDLVTLYTFRKSRKPADASHPFGYGRYEALGTLVVSAFLVAAGLGIGSHALEQIAQFLPDIFASSHAASAQDAIGSAKDMVGAALNSSESLLSFGHSHGAAHEVVDGAVVVDPRAIWFAVGSIVVNEVLFQATMKVGKRTSSNVLIANAWHHRSDALTSLVSVGAIGGAILGFPVLDALGGLVVSAMLAKSGVSMMADAAREVTDTPPSPQHAEDVAKALDNAISAVPAVRGYTTVQCRKSGPFVHVRIGLQFGSQASASEIVSSISLIRQILHDKVNYLQDIDIDIEIK
ncbi:mitochondrial metal transporter [Coemansia brasiliensis]|uniref:Mitochondrial metal transporter n=1 Tax=Coemansia brasiliensis TaxID=2650707 RepID=A0A9W8M0G3_9FUNG|nr:mitochondrial metal transporter [Coemansia brasiliensis]